MALAEWLLAYVSPISTDLVGQSSGIEDKEWLQIANQLI